MPAGGKGWDETESTFRYRVADPGEFITDSFRSKDITGGVSLTLAKRTNDGPMETQSIVFSKEQFPNLADAKTWLGKHPDIEKHGDKQDKGEGMSSIDVLHLENYIVIPTGSDDPAGVDDLRELSGDFPSGVHALWSDKLSTVVAFAFEKTLFNEASAQAWIDENGSGAEEAEGMSVIEVARAVAHGVTEAVMAAVNKGRVLSAKTVGGKWLVMQTQRFPLAPESTPWAFGPSDENDILDKGGWEMFARAHLVVDMGQSGAGQSYPKNKSAYTHPVAKLLDGKLSYILAGAQAVYSNLRGGRGGVDLPSNVKAEELKIVKAIYARFGKDTSAMKLDASGEPTATLPITPAIAALSFDELRRALTVSIDAGDLMLPEPANPAGVAPVGYPVGGKEPWLVDFGTESAVIAWGDTLYSVPFTITGGTVTWGTPALVGPERKFVRLDGTPVMLHAFTVHLGAGDDAQADKSDGLIWKELIHPGKWQKTDSGRPIEVVLDMILSVYEAWKNGLPKFISVPADDHHGETGGIVPVEANRGFVEKLKLIGNRLFGGFRFTDPVTAAGVQSGGIADCSVYLQPNAIHPTSGKVYSWILRHVLLTNDPLAQDLAPFGVAAEAQGQQVIVQTYKEVNVMTKEIPVTPTTPVPAPVAPAAPIAASASSAASAAPATAPVGPAEPTPEAVELAAFKAVGMTAEQVKALAAQKTAIEAQAAQNRAKARDLEITSVVMALEGRDTREGVAAIPGYRHYPVVIAAVEKALKEQPQALALSSDDSGHTTLDAVVLAVANAIPQEGRMALSDQPTVPQPPIKPDDSREGKIKRARKLGKEAGLPVKE